MANSTLDGGSPIAFVEQKRCRPALFHEASSAPTREAPVAAAVTNRFPFLGEPNAYSYQHEMPPGADMHPYCFQGSEANDSEGGDGPSDAGCARAQRAPKRRRKLVSDIKDDRAQRCRERNREHARRTRMRKKEQMQHLTDTLKRLQDQDAELRDALDVLESATTLLAIAKEVHAFSGSSSMSPSLDVHGAHPYAPLNQGLDPEHCRSDESSESGEDAQANTGGGTSSASEDERFLDHLASPQDIDMALAGSLHAVTKAKLDEFNASDRSELTPQQMHEIRKERNRMHAKLTRERKKLLLMQTQQNIEFLERKISNRREKLDAMLRPFLGPMHMPQVFLRLGLAHHLLRPEPMGVPPA